MMTYLTGLVYGVAIAKNHNAKKIIANVILGIKNVHPIANAMGVKIRKKPRKLKRNLQALDCLCFFHFFMSLFTKRRK